MGSTEGLDTESDLLETYLVVSEYKKWNFMKEPSGNKGTSSRLSKRILCSRN